MADIEIDEWHNLYGSRWGGEITPESVAHPAKFNRKLIERIYRHAVDDGWLTPGSTVIDPFGGIALGAFPAMRLGMRWIGVELEPRFVMMGNSNLDLWNYRYAGKLPGWGSARLIRGDSRQMVALLAKYAAPDLQGACNGEATALAVASPPFLDSLSSGKADWLAEQKLAGKVKTTSKGHNIGKYAKGDKLANYGAEPGQLGGMPSGDVDLAVSSPPFLQVSGGAGVKPGVAPGSILADPRMLARHSAGNPTAKGYGHDPASLTNKPVGDLDAAIASPPFGDSLMSGKISVETAMNITRKAERTSRRGYSPAAMQREAERKARGLGHSYGVSDGQLAKLPVGDADAAVSSPPFAESTSNDPRPNKRRPGYRKPQKGGALHGEYGASAGQIAAAPADTFWNAARDIVAQTFAVLRPGGHAIWVCKGYVKGGKLVDFPDQWRRLCESVGFVTLHLHKAMVVEDHGTQKGLDGHADKHYRAEHKSFFRRLHESQHPDTRIDYETVLCFEKPK